jgi:hypothetical protein
MSLIERESKKGTYYRSEIQVDGRVYKKSWGRVSKSTAKDQNTKWEADILNGRYKRKVDNPRFDKCLKEHLKKAGMNCTPSTVARYEDSAKHLKAHFGAKRIDQIEDNQILMRKFVEKRKGQIREKQAKQGRAEGEYSYTSINRDLGLLRAVFRGLIDQGKATPEPHPSGKQIRGIPQGSYPVPRGRGTAFRGNREARQAWGPRSGYPDPFALFWMPNGGGSKPPQGLDKLGEKCYHRPSSFAEEEKKA